MDAEAQAARIRENAAALDFTQQAVESLARSWEHTARGDEKCSQQALLDAIGWGILSVERRLEAILSALTRNG